MRRIATVLAAAVALGAGSLLTASPASAAEVNWKEVNTNSTWTCTPYVWHKVSKNVNFKTCIVWNGHAAQSVLVVQNKASVAVQIDGQVLTDFGGDADCAQSTLNPGFTRGCFGRTVEGAGPGNSIDGLLVLNGQGERWTDAWSRLHV